MTFLTQALLGFIMVLPAGYMISRFAWPRIETPLRGLLALLISGLLFLVDYFIIISVRDEMVLPYTLVIGLFWLSVGLVSHLLYGPGSDSTVARRLRENRHLSQVSRFGWSNFLLATGVLLLLLSFAAVPLLFDLDTNLIWRYRAYMLALGSIAVFGLVIRKKALAVVLGIGLLIAATFICWFGGIYPVGAPLLRASSEVTEGLESDLPFMDAADLGQVTAMLSRFSLALDLPILALSVAFVGVASVLVADSILSRGTGRSALVILLAILLLIPGLLIPYSYSLTVGGVEYLGKIGRGAIQGLAVVEMVNESEFGPDELNVTRDAVSRAGESFNDSRELLLDLEQLKLFDFLGLLPYLGEHSESIRHLTWGIQNGGEGLQICASGSLEVFDGVLTVFDIENSSVRYLDILGPKMVDEEIDPHNLNSGLRQMDGGFVSISSGFPLLRQSISNLTVVEIGLFTRVLPDMTQGLEELRNSSQELEDGVYVGEVFLNRGSTDLTPSTHLLYAAYSLAESSSQFTDLRDPRELPSLQNVESNLTYVKSALSDPDLVRLREEGGEVGKSLVFIEDAIELIENVIDLTQDTRRVAGDLDTIRGEIREESVQNVTDLELTKWKSKASVLVQDSIQLREGIDSVQTSIEEMMGRAMRDAYGYANELADNAVDLLEQVLDLLYDLRELVEISDGVESLIEGIEDYHDFYYQLNLMQRQIESDNLESAKSTCDAAKLDLGQGKARTEELLSRIQLLSETIRIPISESSIEDILDTASDIELKIEELRATLDEGEKQEALDLLSEIREEYSELGQRLKSMAE